VADLPGFGLFEPSPPDVLCAALRVLAGMGRFLACGGTLGFLPRPFGHSVGGFEPAPLDVFDAAVLRAADGMGRSLACGGTTGFFPRPFSLSVVGFGGFVGLDGRTLGLSVLAAWAAENQYGSTLMEVDAELFALGFEEPLLAEMAI